MGKEIEYIMVDLGLPSGLKWADRNVGAVNVHDYGDYFMWGSTEPDTENVCDWAHAPFNKGSEKFDETYFNEHKSEWLTEDGTLKSEYDAASANMGDGWRMPTKNEFDELVGCTTCTAEDFEGVKWLRFFSNRNGESIFIPLSGRRIGSEFEQIGDFGMAFSSSVEAPTFIEMCNGSLHFLCGLESAYFLKMYDDGRTCTTHYDSRYRGLSVRGVHG